MGVFHVIRFGEMLEEKTDDDKQLFHTNDKGSGKACFLKMDSQQYNKK